MKIIDIETVPQPGIMQTWFPEWARRKMPDATDEELERSASLHGEFGMVCAIGVTSAGALGLGTWRNAVSLKNRKPYPSNSGVRCML